MALNTSSFVIFFLIAIVNASIHDSHTGEDNNDGFARSRYRRNNVATDPNNIRFVLGHTQLFPILEEADENTPRTLQPALTNSKIPELSADIGNKGGTHQNNVNIGGIQNFGGGTDLKAEIAKLIVDKDNVGGSHQNNVAIGGILNFN